jgi:hypothetical protein
MLNVCILHLIKKHGTTFDFKCSNLKKNDDEKAIVCLVACRNAFYA